MNTYEKERTEAEEVVDYINRLKEEIETLQRRNKALIDDAIGTEKALTEAYGILDSMLKTSPNCELDNQENTI